MSDITNRIEILFKQRGLKRAAFCRYFNEIKNIFKDCEERKLCFHSLRHFFITNAKASGVNDIKVECIAGHSLKGIAKVYTNFKPEDLFDICSWQKETLSHLDGCERAGEFMTK